MSPIQQILTHPGGAHKDEFLACSVLLALHPVALVRREPVAADLDNPTVAVVDVGHRHEPALANFDHHQLPKNHPPTCSLSLVLQHLGLYEDARQFCDWLEPAEWFDCRGPLVTARWLGIDPEVVNQLNSPIDITLLRRFALVQELAPGQPLWEMMRMIGQDQSLNAPVAEAGDGDWQGLLADERPSPEQVVTGMRDARTRSAWLAEALADLNPRERMIIERRRLHEQGATLEDLGRELGISKERVRQLEGRALLKLRETLTQRADTPSDLLAGA